MTEGIDYSYARPDPDKIYAAGKRFVCRYLTVINDRTEGKLLTRPEAIRLRAAGLSIVSNWEFDAGDARGGYANGRRYAQLAAEQHADAGGPPDRPIYFSVDWDASLADLQGPVSEYFRGIGSVLPASRIGVYGGIDTVRYFKSRGIATWAWQTYAWSGGQWYPRNNIEQYHNGVTLAGGAVDLNRATTTDYGQWGVDMPLSATDLEALADKLATDEEFLAAICKTVWKRDGIVGNVPGGPGAPDNATVKGETLAQLAAGGVLALTAKVDALPAHPIVVDAAVLKAALMDPEYLEAVARAVAGEIAGRLDA